MPDQITYGEFWLPGGSDAHPDNPLAYCHRCGAIVLHTDAHTRWHNEQPAAAAAPYGWPWQCESCGGDIVRNGDTWRHVAGPGCDDLTVPLTALGGDLPAYIQQARTATALVPGAGAIVTHGELPAGYIPPSASMNPLAAPAERDLAAIRGRIKRAHTEIGDIAYDGAHRRWRMSIPAQPDRDSDLIISAALNDAELLAAEVEQLRGQRDAALDLHQPDDEGRCKKCVQSWAHEETEAFPCRTARALGVEQ